MHYSCSVHQPLNFRMRTKQQYIGILNPVLLVNLPLLTTWETSEIKVLLYKIQPFTIKLHHNETMQSANWQHYSYFPFQLINYYMGCPESPVSSTLNYDSRGNETCLLNIGCTQSIILEFSEECKYIVTQRRKNSKRWNKKTMKTLILPHNLTQMLWFEYFLLSSAQFKLSN